MAMADEPDFDWSQAASLLGDEPENVPEDMAAIVQELIETTRMRLQELKDKNLESDDKAIRSLAHQLRGSLLNFGFTGVGATLWKVEKTEYTPEEYQQMLAEIDTLFADSTKMLAQHYPSLQLP
ncbi:Hpt domain-containing protein [Methylacidiphilales bacterium]|nr:Hpt domain-containing protein [Candidatus Methylacidiphilales bacterium]